MLDVLARSERYVDGVELDDLAGFGGSGGFGQALGEAPTFPPTTVPNSELSLGRGRGIRTHGPLLPKRAAIQDNQLPF